MNKNPDFTKGNLVLESALFVRSRAVDVKIDEKALERFAGDISLQKLDHWLSHSPVSLAHLSQDELLAFIFIFNSLSFSYWGDPDYFFVHEGKTYQTSWGLVVALAIAAKQDARLLDVSFVSKASDEYLARILNKDCVFPMFKERCDILRLNASIIAREFKGDLKELIQAADRDVAKFLNILHDRFTAFRDESVYKARTIYFMKKAQVLIADIDKAFLSPLGKLDRSDMLTACADYRLPQLLRQTGSLVYSEKLASLVDSRTQIEKGSSYETEIRSCTIVANEMIREFLEKKYGQRVRAIDVNDYLWLNAKSTQNMKPYHLVRTTMY